MLNTPPPTCEPAPERSGLQLVPFCFWLARPCGCGPATPAPRPDELADAIRAHLTGLGLAGSQPLRWAITAVDPLRGLQLEGVSLQERGSLET